jgi:hypothetical protein
VDGLEGGVALHRRTQGFEDGRGEGAGVVWRLPARVTLSRSHARTFGSKT